MDLEHELTMGTSIALTNAFYMLVEELDGVGRLSKAQLAERLRAAAGGLEEATAADARMRVQVTYLHLRQMADVLSKQERHGWTPTVIEGGGRSPGTTG